MKSSSIAIIAASLAVVSAAPASTVQARDEQAANGLFPGGGLFGQGSNIFSSIFDGAACIVSSFIGGGNPRCSGQGHAEAKPPKGDSSSSSSSSNSNGASSAYSFSYDTNQDGSLKVTITLQKGGSCTYNINADGKQVQDVIEAAAQKCLAK